jgi:hypothetical protein
MLLLIAKSSGDGVMQYFASEMEENQTKNGAV